MYDAGFTGENRFGRVPKGTGIRSQEKVNEYKKCIAVLCGLAIMVSTRNTKTLAKHPDNIKCGVIVATIAWSKDEEPKARANG